MRHLRRGRQLGRNQDHRIALFRNLTMALFTHRRIITTLEKAKEARKFAEKLITLAKKNTLHARRLCLSRLRDKKTVELLFNEIAPLFTNREGGYTRVLKRQERRLGDGGQTAFLELVLESRTKTTTTKPAVVIEAEPKS